MLELVILTSIIIVPIVLAGLLSASETAITAISLAKIHKLKTNGNKRAQVISDLREDKESLISTILLANSTFNIIASTVATAVLIRYFGEGGVIYATVLMTILIIVFAEILPKTYAIAYPEQVALSFAYFLKIAVAICSPITRTINVIVVFILKLFKMHDASNGSIVSPTEEIRGTIEMHHKQGSVDHGDKYMFDGIFYLSETNVGKVMTHRKNMRSINIDLDIENIIAQIKDIGHTRIPVWQNNSDNIIGILNTRDLLYNILEKQNFNEINIKDLIAEPIFIHENTALDIQLAEFKEQKARFAIVIDEYGDIQGLITLSDILEEVVGCIHDERDKAQEEIICLNGACTVKGDLAVRDLNRMLHWNLPEDEATIAGLLIHELEQIPEVGENFAFNGFNFVVLAKEGNQLTNIRIEKMQNE
jgi:Mg2+/Co2+ transporter CorB